MKTGRRPDTKGVEEARKSLPAILEAAARGRTTIITRHGRALAAVVPVDAVRSPRAPSILSLAGTGKGLWGRDSATTIRKLRDEWKR